MSVPAQTSKLRSSYPGSRYISASARFQDEPGGSFSFYRERPVDVPVAESKTHYTVGKFSRVIAGYLGKR